MQVLANGGSHVVRGHGVRALERIVVEMPAPDSLELCQPLCEPEGAVAAECPCDGDLRLRARNFFERRTVRCERFERSLGKRADFVDAGTRGNGDGDLE